MAERTRIVGGRRDVFCPVVLAPAGMARLSGGNRRGGALAIAGGYSVGARFRRRAALRLGFRLDRTWNSRADCAAPVPGRGRLLSLCTESHVCGLCRWLDRLVDCLRTCQPTLDRRRGRCGSGRAFVCCLL